MRRLRRWLFLAGLLAGGAILLQHPTAMAMVRWWPDPLELVVPVQGVVPTALHSSFGEPRSGHRTHAGIDIFARRGTPVVAAASGRVTRVGHNTLGGKCVWVAGAGARFYYYAHLDGFAPGLRAGDTVAAGDTLGRVGNTGNAVTTPPHLHFGVYPLTHCFRAVDPAPLLRAHLGRSGRHA